VRWEDAACIADLRRLAPSLAEALTGKPLDFFLPSCTAIHWEVERKPFDPDALVLWPHQPVSRAWDFLFRIALERIAPHGWGPPAYLVSPHVGAPAQGPRNLAIELPDRSREATGQAVAAVNAATAVANAVVAEAAVACRREHDELARDVGLDRPDLAFRAERAA
jgi:hypothetical protein